MFKHKYTFSKLYFVKHRLDLEDLLPRVFVQIQVVEAALLQAGVHGQHQRSATTERDFNLFRGFLKGYLQTCDQIKFAFSYTG